MIDKKKLLESTLAKLNQFKSKIQNSQAVGAALGPGLGTMVGNKPQRQFVSKVGQGIEKVGEITAKQPSATKQAWNFILPKKLEWVAGDEAKIAGDTVTSYGRTLKDLGNKGVSAFNLTKAPRTSILDFVGSGEVENVLNLGDAIEPTGIPLMPFAGTIAGLNAQSFLGKQGDDLAQEILKKGAYSDVKDKGLRFFISDNYAKLNRKVFNKLTKTIDATGQPAETTLGEFLKHDELYKEYPQAKNLKVIFNPAIDARGQFDPNTGEITLNPKEGDWMEKLGTLLHENQHLLQSVEGFSSGSNPITAGLEYSNEQITFLNRTKEELAKKYFNTQDTQIRAQILQRLNYVDKAISKEMNKNAMSAYKSTKGELEARAVQNPKNLRLPLKELKGKDILAEQMKLEGIKPNEVIVRGSNGVSASADDALIQEARKYKSAEEFVNNKAKFVHETNAPDIKEFDINKVGSGQGESWLGKGVYLQEGGSFKMESYGKNKMQAGLSPDAKIFEIKETPNGEYRDSFVEYAVKNDIGNARSLAESRTKDGLSLKNLLPRDILKNSSNATEQLKKNGFDGLLQDGELVVYNPNVLKTKSQLTDIWNQANNVMADVGDRVEQTFRVDKFDLNQEQAQTLDELRKTLGFDDRTVKSFEDMKEQAEALGLEPTKLVRDIVNGRITSAEVVALGNVISTSQQRVTDLTQQLVKDPTNATIRSQIQAEERLLNEAIKKRIKGGTEAGRAVVAYRILANKTLDPVYWIDKAKRQVGEDIELDAEVITEINRLIGEKDRLGLAQFINGLGESSSYEKFTALWKAGLLTAPTTHLRNVISNFTMGGLETAKDIPATAFDMVRATITGNPRAKTFNLGMITSQGSGAKRGIKMAKEALGGASDPKDILKIELYKPIRFGNTRMGRVAQKYVNAVFNTLGAEDKVFREMAFSKSLREQATLRAINENLTAAQVMELMENPSQDILDIAIKDSEYATFTNENGLNNAIRGFKSRGGDKIRATTDVIVPFTKTPTNVAKAFFDYSPAGIVAKTLEVTSRVISGEAVDQKELAEAFGRSATGMALILAGYELAKAGKISGPSPKSESERSQKELENRLNNAILVGGKWRSLNAISPMGSLLLLGAAYHDTGSFLNTIPSGIKSLTEQTFLKGLSGGLQAINDPQRYGDGFIKNFAGSQVPNVVRKVAQGLDTDAEGNRIVRDPQNALQAVQEGIPGVRELLPEKTTALGDTKTYEGGVISGAFDPFSSTTPSDDPLVQEFSRIGFNLNKVGNTISVEGENMALSPAQKNEYQRLVGEYIRQELDPVIASPSYQALDDTEKLGVVEKYVTAAKSKARNEIKTKLSEISDSGLQKAQALEDKPEEKSVTTNFVFIDEKGSVRTVNIPEKPDSSDKVATAKWEAKAYAGAKQVLTAPNKTIEEKYEVLEKMGLNPEEVEYYTLTRETNLVRGIYIKEQIAQYSDSQRGEMLKDLVQMRRVLQGRMLLSDDTIDELIRDEVLTKAEGKQLKGFRLNEDGEVKVKISGRGGGSKIKNIKFVPLNVAGSAPKIKPIKMPLMRLGSSSLKTPKLETAKLPMLKVKTPQREKFQIKFNL